MLWDVEGFLDKVDSIYLENMPTLRYGQCLMNLLFTANRAEYDKIRGTDLDCFYRDDIARKTIKYLEEKYL
jgi:hypothetical protein